MVRVIVQSVVYPPHTGQVCLMVPVQLSTHLLFPFPWPDSVL